MLFHPIAALTVVLVALAPLASADAVENAIRSSDFFVYTAAESWDEVSWAFDDVGESCSSPEQVCPVLRGLGNYLGSGHAIFCPDGCDAVPNEAADRYVALNEAIRLLLDQYAPCDLSEIPDCL